MKKNVQAQGVMISFQGLVDIPDTCPVCHKGVDPALHSVGWCQGEPNDPRILQLVLRCPRDKCQQVYVALYARTDRALDPSDHRTWTLKYCAPIEHSAREFDKAIHDASPAFVSIY